MTGFLRGPLARALAFASLAFTAVTPPAAARPAQDAPLNAAWTLMFYMDCDNNLEAAQLHDLGEMLAVGSTPEVNIVALIDRAASADEDDGYTAAPVGGLKNWETAKLCYLEKGKLQELADWGEADMGDPATLEQFVSTVAEEFPAAHYGVVFGDHGASWPGVCTDDSADDDLLTVGELGAALAETSKTTGRLELVGFDACLMANFEVAHAMAPLAHFMLASEELEPGDGWNYTPLIRSLVANPSMSGGDFGRVAADTFNAFYNGSAEHQEEGLGITLAIISLDRIAALEAAVNALGDRCDASLKSKGRSAWLKLADAQARAEEYGSSGRGERGSAVYDLKDLAERIKRLAPDADTAAAADAVVRAVSDAVLYRVHGAARPNSNGLSIFFPPDGAALTTGEPVPYTQTSFGKASRWAKFLASYTGVEATDTTAPDLAETKTTAPDLEETPENANATVTITSSVKADDLDTADFVLAVKDGEDQLVLGQVPAAVDEQGRLSETWDGGWFTIGNAKSELICPITDFEEVADQEGTYFVEVPAQVRPKGSAEWDDVTLYFYLDFGDDGSVKGEFVYAFQDTRSGLREYEIDVGDSVRPVYLVYDARGDEHYEASDHPDDILKLETSDDLVVGYADVDAGEYLLGFVATDFAGNYAEEYVEVTVGGEEEEAP
jgi:hypothetical protein